METGFEPEFHRAFARTGRLWRTSTAERLFDIMKFPRAVCSGNTSVPFRLTESRFQLRGRSVAFAGQSCSDAKKPARAGLLTVFEKLFRDYQFHLAGSA